MDQVERIGQRPQPGPLDPAEAAGQAQGDQQEQAEHGGDDAGHHIAVDSHPVMSFEARDQPDRLIERQRQGGGQQTQPRTRGTLAPDQVAKRTADEVDRVLDQEEIPQHPGGREQLQNDRSQQPEGQQGLRTPDAAEQQHQGRESIEAQLVEECPVDPVDARDTHKAAEHRHVDEVLAEAGMVIGRADHEGRDKGDRTANPEGRIEPDHP
ncbi:MAG: hypothetical protein BWY87_01715 [Deltaproteobacteria bacterium ADurb.Bin510]|nr:MAG: hypothetical protein BWY87_01715 [Deltaproteobacteria bacterium ADurb.Bin510]